MPFSTRTHFFHPQKKTACGIMTRKNIITTGGAKFTEGNMAGIGKSLMTGIISDYYSKGGKASGALG
ncbi:MAG: hypothetical protein KJ985_00510, partial [Proteobacteria bacterium]|nr:hypothetical protein [Pseudomonadota bacterium]